MVESVGSGDNPSKRITKGGRERGEREEEREEEREGENRFQEQEIE